LQEKRTANQGEEKEEEGKEEQREM
jgi:hypothetical protein